MTKFSIENTLKEAWELYKKHYKFFLGFAVITAILNIVGNGDHTPTLIVLILGIASFIWSIIWKKVCLAAARNDESKLSFNSLRSLTPTFIEALMFIGVMLLTMLLIFCGLILLVIPGIYVAVRLSFATFAYFDRKESIRKSVRYSWDITKGNFWLIILTILVGIGVYILGVLAIVIGLLVAYPLVGILFAKLYVNLSDNYNNQKAIVEQPTEIPASL